MKKFLSVLGALSLVALYGMSIEELNIVTKEQLMEINGIGKSKAEAIIKYREEHPFKSLEEVEEVSGIGPSLAKTIKESVIK